MFVPENSHGQKPNNFNKLKDPLPCRGGIHEEFVPNAGLILGFMPLFLIKHLVVPFHPNGPKRNTLEKMPNFDQFAEFVRDYFAKNRLFPIETIKVAGPDSA